ncbi:DNA-binding protein [Kribbella capetownensis]|uniref:DNA-binding protein n=1 Tax=Kribbella capetownensis TaxID=1572659 RepID=A0A4R0INH0_9ACTN|nr:helix-turn-helix domain-containing protein [Kribbella capetownensis]TCC33894.1 DNA-binding protein [Kribbella capetownensis]
MGTMMVAVNPGIEKLFERYGDECLTPEQVGEALGLEASSVRRQLRAAELPGYRLGTGAKAQWRLVKSEVIAVLRTRWNQDQHLDPQATVAATAGSKE